MQHRAPVAQRDESEQSMVKDCSAQEAAYLLVDCRVGDEAVFEVQGDPGRVDGVQGDVQLGRHHRQGVAVDACDNAAPKIRNCCLPLPLPASIPNLVNIPLIHMLPCATCMLPAERTVV